MILIREFTPRPKDPGQDMPLGAFTFKVSVQNEEGSFQKMAKVKINAPDNLYPQEEEKEANAQSIKDSGDWYASFEYVPISVGKKTLTFSCGEEVLPLIINVK